VGIAFAKGHGTGNDFVVVPDLADRDDLTAEQVRAICDRQTGIGADGLLRVLHRDGHYFMDYRNADGSIAEMCGNGARVFVRYLIEEGLAAPGDLVIGTRGGDREVSAQASGDISVVMGVPTTPQLRAVPVVTVGDRSWNAVGVHIPNPHAVVFVDSLDDAGALRAAPEFSPHGVFPDGVNVEFVVSIAEAHVAMRVFERGVGETLSCGTGACAVVWAARRQDGAAQAQTWIVDVPGGRLEVTERADGQVVLTGPAVIVTRGEIDLSAL
jgi:diaminopimelate epimerase